MSKTVADVVKMGADVQMVDLPPSEQRPDDIPSLALPIRRANECPLVRSDQYTYSAHTVVLRL